MLSYIIMCRQLFFSRQDETIKTHSGTTGEGFCGGVPNEGLRLLSTHYLHFTGRTLNLHCLHGPTHLRQVVPQVQKGQHHFKLKLRELCFITICCVVYEMISTLLVLKLEYCRKTILGALCEYHGRWCPGFLCYQCISSHCVDYVV